MVKLTYKTIKEANIPELIKEAKYLREFIIESVSNTGGHLGSNLGTVELTIALLKVLDLSKDKIIWDTGHQTYAYKILTDRKERFSTLRTKDGISGFLSREESPLFDHFGVGHASTAVSAAYGIVEGQNFLHVSGQVVSVIGDSSLSGGLTFEGLNNVGNTTKPLNIILNDNNMAISQATGAVSKYLTNFLDSTSWQKTRSTLHHFVDMAPEPMGAFSRKVKELAKQVLLPKQSEDTWEVDFFLKNINQHIGNFFEDLGFDYRGPVDGHDIQALVPFFQQIYEPHQKPLLLHVRTKKGKGYLPAEKAKDKLHGVGKFYINTGKPFTTPAKTVYSYSKIVGKTLTYIAQADPKVIAITAAMAEGTGLHIFESMLPDRFFDVGIAEAHGVTFAGGMATTGMKPFVAIYSTFLQRAYDSIIHDIVMQKLPVKFLLDRAGFVGEDGPTHHGVFDLAYLNTIPDCVVSAPRNVENLIAHIKTAYAYEKGPIFVRYPKHSAHLPNLVNVPPRTIGKAEILRKGKDILVLGLGSLIESICNKDVWHLWGEVKPTLVDMHFLKPMDIVLLDTLIPHYQYIVTIEEGVSGGLNLNMAMYLQQKQYKGMYVPIFITDPWLPVATRAQQLEMAGLDSKQLIQRILSVLLK